MSDILGIVSFATLRATVGMSEADADDAVVSSLNLQDEVEISLQGWLPDYSAIIADTWSGGTAEQRDFILIRLKAWTKYFAAATLAVSAPGLLLRRLTDGENEGQRFDNVKPEQIADRLFAKASDFREAIENELDTEEAAATFSMFGVVSPNYDPVVGE